MEQKFSHKTLLLSSPTRAFGSVQTYIQGPGELSNVFHYGKKFGKKFFFIIDSGVFDMIKAIIDGVEDREGCDYTCKSFIGECCQENVDMLTEATVASGCDVVLGVGGGKVLDIAKLVADQADVARIIVPTSASSDAPAADWASVYDINGVHLGGVATRRCTELVLADSAIIAKAPARLFAAGIADALVTYYEAEANERSFTPNYIGKGYARCRAGMAVARECLDILLSDGRMAYKAVKNKLLTEAVENVIEANILLSGLGFMNTGCAGAHGIHNGISEIPETVKYLHGEKVAFGLICEMLIQNRPEEEIMDMIAFLDELELPVTMEQFELECSEKNLDIIVDHTYAKGLIHREPVMITADAIRNVILQADSLGREYRASKA